MEKPHYERATGKLRQVLIENWEYFEAAGIPARRLRSQSYRLQEQWEVQDGEPKDATREPPGYGQDYVEMPGRPLWWIPVRYEYRDVPIVSETEVAAERVAAGRNQISTE